MGRRLFFPVGLILFFPLRRKSYGYDSVWDIPLGTVTTRPSGHLRSRRPTANTGAAEAKPAVASVNCRYFS